MPIASDLRKGNAIRYGDDICLVLDVQHRTPGNLRAFVQATLRNLRTGRSSQVRFSATVPVEIVALIKKAMEYSYRDGSGYVFLDPETFDQITLGEEVAGPTRDYLVEGTAYDLVFSDDQPVELELPPSVILTVEEAQEGLKGNSATNVRKPVRLETGLELNVPLFIRAGEKIRVDTRTGEYLARA